MYLLKVEASFDAAHRLPEYNGPCRRVHGHHWVVQATYKYTGLRSRGITIDLVILRKLLRGVVSKYDHQSLNQLMACTPTAENLARDIFDDLQGKDFGEFMSTVAVEETPGTSIIYHKDSPTHEH